MAPRYDDTSSCFMLIEGFSRGTPSQSSHNCSGSLRASSRYSCSLMRLTTAMTYASAGMTREDKENGNRPIGSTRGYHWFNLAHLPHGGTQHGCHQPHQRTRISGVGAQRYESSLGAVGWGAPGEAFDE